ncbi:helix-turn-helix domain-containing protein [Pseudoduganella plicata]|uniref:AraC family transcriptional regulator n=1 Tax=Pseudoduganella plicata TaxID=321984 RepID=A0A4P7BBI0_9BURK|nr:helix-turn-helix domain-containing protein [Pseudoduganella plicata]QBQ34795.1 helix-turn-helix domain-containing protein [Pseudoduganella plicata]GGY88572.1 AraC family transcriptional regulator [Pseudoduganella plicata]
MKTLPREMPRFALYGDNAAINNAEFVHIEPILPYERPKGWHVGPHVHRGLYQLVFLMTGRATAQVENMVWQCDGPAVIAIPPTIPHSCGFRDQADGWVVSIDHRIVASLNLFAPLFERPQALRLQEAPEVRERLTALLRELAAEARGPRYGQPLMVEWLARGILLLLVRLDTERRLADESGREDFELFSAFRALVEQHYREQWLVARYAEELGVTPARLSRVCEKLADKSAFDMAQGRLLLEACRKLTYMPASIASVGEELGFRDPAYFSRLFKKLMGVTPKQFRERALHGTTP